MHSDQFTELKKQKRTAELEKAKEIQQLQSRNNQLQTDYENAKLSTVVANKKAKEAVDEVERVVEETKVQQKLLDDKIVEVQKSVDEIASRNSKIEELKQAIKDKEQEM